MLYKHFIHMSLSCSTIGVDLPDTKAQGILFYSLKNYLAFSQFHTCNFSNYQQYVQLKNFNIYHLGSSMPTQWTFSTCLLNKQFNISCIPAPFIGCYIYTLRFVMLQTSSPLMLTNILKRIIMPTSETKEQKNRGRITCCRSPGC